VAVFFGGGFGSMHRSGKLVVIDNYDSFTYNLVQMFMPFGLDIQVHRSDVISVREVLALGPDFILISPGPKDPPAAGISMELIRQCYQIIPILGVCLGMQSINAVFGGKTVRCHRPVHGKTDRIRHDQKGIFQGLPSPFTAARYHSLKALPTDAALADELMVTARTEENLIMGLSHRRYPLHGVQFHPESFLTEHGFDLVENFLRCGTTPNKRAIINPLEFSSPEACNREMRDGF
jgi:anthranilate synthase/aminodeoxychorismate synthase-like glutamine amidotransferase